MKTKILVIFLTVLAVIGLTVGVTVFAEGTVAEDTLPEAIWGASADDLGGDGREGTLSEAVYAAEKEGSTVKYIKLMKDIAVSGINGQSMRRGEYTLDLNGKSVTASGGAAFAVYGANVTFCDSVGGGTVTGDKDGYIGSGIRVEYGNATVNGGTYNGDSGLSVLEEGTAVINEGVFKTQGSVSVNVFGELTVTGGVFECGTKASIRLNWGSISINALSGAVELARNAEGTQIELGEGTLDITEYADVDGLGISAYGETIDILIPEGYALYKENTKLELPENGILTVKNTKVYNVIIADGIVGGEVTADKAVAEAGETVTLIIELYDGYDLESLTITYLGVTELVEYDTFTMPAGDVTVNATFVEIADEAVAWQDTDGDLVLDEGEATFSTLKAALTAGGNIVMVNGYNATSEGAIELYDVNATLDLNGYGVVTESKNFIVLYSGQLTVKDSDGGGSMESRAGNSYVLYVCGEDAHLNVNGGFYTGYYAVVITSGSVTVNGGEKVGGDHVFGITGGSLVINDVTVESVGWGIIVNGGTVEVNGGSFKNCLTGIEIYARNENSGAYVTLNDGEWSADDEVIAIAAGDTNRLLTINGGTYEGALYDAYGGRCLTTGGSFSSHPLALLTAGYKAVKNPESGYWEVVVDDGSEPDVIIAWQDTDGDKLLDEGETTFTTLKAALYAGGNIVMKEDYDATLEGEIELYDVSVTLDLNGYELVSYVSKFINIYTAQLTVNDGDGSGSIVLHASNGVVFSLKKSAAQLILNGGSYYSFQSTVEIFKGSLALNGGKSVGTAYAFGVMDGSLTVNDVTVEDATYGILLNGGTVTVNDGSFMNCAYGVGVFVPEGYYSEIMLDGGYWSCEELIISYDSPDTWETSITDGIYIGAINAYGGKVSATGGSFSSEPTAIVAEGYAAALNTVSGYWEIFEDGTVTAAEAIWGTSADDLGGDGREGTLYDAIAAAEAEGSTVKYIKLTADVETGYTWGYVMESGEYTLDLNGRNVTSTGGIAFFVSGAKVTFCDTLGGGTVTGALGEYLGYGIVVEAGNVTVNGGIYDGNGGIMVQNGAVVTVNGGTFKTQNQHSVSNEGALTITGGSFENGSYGVISQVGGALKIEAETGKVIIARDGECGALQISGGKVDLSGYADINGLTVYFSAVPAEGDFVIPEEYALFDEKFKLYEIAQYKILTVRNADHAPAKPVITEISINTDSPAYDAATNTFTVSKDHPLIVTVKGVGLTLFGEHIAAGLVNTGNVFVPNEFTIDSDTELKLAFTLEICNQMVKGWNLPINRVAVFYDLETLDCEMYDVNVKVYLPIVIEKSANGEVTFSPADAEAGDTVTLNVVINEGYELESLNVTDKNGNSVEYDENYSFVIPEGGVTVTAVFKFKGHGKDGYEIVWSETFDGEGIPEGFTSVDKDGDGICWHTKLGDIVGHDCAGGNLLMSPSYSHEIGRLNTQHLLLLPTFELAEGREYLFSFMVKAQDKSFPDKYNVHISLDGGETYVWSRGEEASTGNWQEVTIDLSEYAGESVTVVIEHKDYDMFYLLVDCMYLHSKTATGPVEPETEVTFAGASLSAGVDLSMNYHVNIPDAISEGKTVAMRFTMNGKTVTVTEYGRNGETYVFSFTDIAPQCMTDSIKAEVLLDGETVAEKDGYSVRKYADGVIALYADDEAMMQLVADLLNYGTAAQTYRGYKTDALANAGITAIGSDALPTEADKITSKVTADGVTLGEVKITGATVRFDYINRIGIRFSSIENAKLVVNGKAVTLDGDIYYTEGIHATEFDKVFTFELYEGDTLIQTFTYSVTSYIYSQMNKTADGELTAMAELARALYRYGKSAEAYVAENQNMKT